MRASHEFEGRSFALGPFIKSPVPQTIEVVAHAGFDFAVADMEHTPLDPQGLYPMLLAAERHDLDLIVRLPARDEIFFKWVLDLGVRNVQVPFVETAADARDAVRLSRFAPEGERGLCRFVRSAGYSSVPRSQYLAEANNSTRLILQIESANAVSNIAEIAAVPGIDTIFIGPYDLSQSLGVPGQIWDQTVVDAMERVIDVCRSRGVNLGTFTDSVEGVEYWARAGASLIEYGSDYDLMLRGSASLRTPFTPHGP